MNLAEGLAREILRVAALRSQYEALRQHPYAAVEPVITMMSTSLEQACKAAGGNNGIEGMMVAMQDLKGYEK